jgi:hypothetical protein
MYMRLFQVNVDFSKSLAFVQSGFVIVMNIFLCEGCKHITDVQMWNMLSAFIRTKWNDTKRCFITIYWKFKGTSFNLVKKHYVWVVHKMDNLIYLSRHGLYIINWWYGRTDGRTNSSENNMLSSWTWQHKNVDSTFKINFLLIDARLT